MEKINDRLISLRKLFRLTQQDLAKELNISDKVISKWESGESVPNLENINNISEYFKVSFDYLIKGIININDKKILEREPTQEERDDEFIQVCKKLIKERNLQKYSDILLPKKTTRILKGKEYYDKLESNIFERCNTNLETPYINIQNLIKLDNFTLYQKLIDLPRKKDKKGPLFSKNILGLEDIQDLSDVRFYNLLNSQDSLNKALEKLKPTNPNYWEIIQLLIEKGAKIQKVNSINDLYNSLVFENDIPATQILLEIAKIKNRK